MSIDFLDRGLLRRLGQSKSKGFTSVDLAANIFLVGISVMTQADIVHLA